MAEIGVVHLARAANGPAPFAAFLDSYRARPAGAAHELVVIFKGFERGAVPDEYRDLLRGVAHAPFFFPDEGFDILPYFAAARAFDRPRLLFLNSFSVLLGDGWLAKLDAHARRSGVGMVGATGSYESMYSNYLLELWRGRPRRPHRGALRDAYRGLREARRLRAMFAPFPNFHLRSNALLTGRELMLGLEVGRVDDKLDALRFESGRASWTRQVAARGLRALVVGRDGRGYERGEWPDSLTFRIGEQQNLLVADNRTRQYAEADAEFRRFMTRITWGRGRAGAAAGTPPGRKETPVVGS